MLITLSLLQTFTWGSANTSTSSTQTPAYTAQPIKGIQPQMPPPPNPSLPSAVAPNSLSALKGAQIGKATPSNANAGKKVRFDLEPLADAPVLNGAVAVPSPSLEENVVDVSPQATSGDNYVRYATFLHTLA